MKMQFAQAQGLSVVNNGLSVVNNNGLYVVNNNGLSVVNNGKMTKNMCTIRIASRI